MRTRVWITAVATISALIAAAASTTAVAAEYGVADTSGLVRPAAWAPPQGYVYEAAWLSTSSSQAYCESQGEKGISEGRWTAYACLKEYRGGTDIPLLFQVLYVKK
ncbi:MULTISPECIES: hypothetical protein [Streptomyces]|uniref:hypothetical protein n=1 Tax=Streptomyces TaxID=1883 RepID=UPI0023B7BEAE|nr:MULTISPECIES: hypothetical protein [Streptomyces]MDX3522534.1 hypothetical protein [Streptomyces scabiei]WEH16215.1 hypothetical protein PYR72_21845 [Streptomyces sp. VNUA24]